MRIRRLARALAKKKIDATRDALDEVAEKGSRVWKNSEPELLKAWNDLQSSTKEFASSTIGSASHSLKGLLDSATYTPGKLDQLQKHIRYQGGYYRELNRKTDTLLLGGESIAVLAASSNIPDEIQRAYEAAYPIRSTEISLQSQLSELEGKELQGVVNAVKGKLFELKYTDWLNSGNLPNGNEAILSESATQPGWDIKIEGEDGQIVDSDPG